MQAPGAPACRGCPSRQQTDLNAIFRAARLLLLLANVCRVPFSCYSPDESPDISDRAEPCYLHGEAFCWFPCRYFSLTHPAKYREPGGRLIARRRQCTHVTCLQLHGREGSATFSGTDGRITPGFAASNHAASYPPAVGSQRLLHALPGRRNGFSLHRLNLPDYAPSSSEISAPPAAAGRRRHAGSARQGCCGRLAARGAQGEHLGSSRLSPFCTAGRLFFLLLQSYSNRLKVLKEKKAARYSVYFFPKASVVFLVHDRVLPFAVHSSLALTSR